MLEKLKGLPLQEKVDLFQKVYQDVAFSPSGMMYSMLHFDEDGIRLFNENDFVGKRVINTAVGKLNLDGQWDYLHGENSITVAGMYLASQSFRYEATKSPEAMEQAQKAFNSLDIVYRGL